MERGGARGFVAWHTVSNFFYLVSARQGAAATRRFIDELMQFVDIAPTTTVHLRAASALSFKDFEYAMQVGAALACAAECIATRNARDFRRSPIPALTSALGRPSAPWQNSDSLQRSERDLVLVLVFVNFFAAVLGIAGYS